MEVFRTGFRHSSARDLLILAGLFTIAPHFPINRVGLGNDVLGVMKTSCNYIMMMGT